jgi:3-hydroxyacyl-CoA dehydrogenase/enoyl-CoA hydratase/3-hydroxybutyryl-CoA epimerase
MAEYHWDQDADGIVTVTLDASGKSANTMNAAWASAMTEIVAKLRGATRLKGVVLASAKKTFFAGGDLDEMMASRQSAQDLFEMIERNKGLLREIEKLPVPVVAAINGAALGGGYEICLARNRRIVVDQPSAVVGLPEVTLGLLPGAGGVVRLTALIGLEAALTYLHEGASVPPQKALAAGLVDEIVASKEELIPAAKAWIKANPGAYEQPWDRKGFRYPGGDADSPKVRNVVRMAPTMLYARTRGLTPAPERILDIAVNSMRMGFESALRTESRGLAALLPSQEAKAAISFSFFAMQAIKAGKARPEGDVTTYTRVGVVGAGMMGAGIAWSQASRGIETPLKDTTIEKAEKGKAYSANLADKGVERRTMTTQARDALLAKIAPTIDDTSLKGSQIIIEAVFEDIDLKKTVIGETFHLVARDGIYGSNTSTLPISVLAEFCPEPQRFIGLHFFSPVDKMKIVEIVVGRKTSVDTLRKAYDYVRQIGYLPIVVNDARGFFTSRVFGTYLDEGLQLLRDGVNPVSIERAGWNVGMPVGPLAVHDEVSLELSRKAMETHRKLDAMLNEESGFGRLNTASAEIVPAMCELKRRGRNWDKAGFYDYPEDAPKTLWPGLSRFVKQDVSVSLEDAQDRLLYRQAIETLRCLHEGVLRTEVEGNVGSVVAIGFPRHTGGALQFIRGIGLDVFRKRAAELEAKYGERFHVTGAELARLDGRT